MSYFKSNDDSYAGKKSFISVTDLSTYLYCPRKLFLTKVYQIRPKPTKVASVGSIAHELLKRFSDGYDVILMHINSGDDINSIQNKVYAFFKDIKLGILKEVKNNSNKELGNVNFVLSEEDNVFLDSVVFNEMLFFSDIIDRFVRKYKIFGDKLREKIIPKIYNEVSISSKDSHLKGRVDRILDFKNFKVVMEYKSSARPSKIWESQRIQIGSYVKIINESLIDKNKNNKNDKGMISFNYGYLIYLNGYSRIKIYLE